MNGSPVYGCDTPHRDLWRTSQPSRAGWPRPCH